MTASADYPHPVSLALEGGGALGAFTWGVLDRLLDEPDLDIRVVSGTSAGALNGAMLVQGLVAGGPEAAKSSLQTLWQRVSIAAGSLPGSSNLWMQVIAGTWAPVVEAVRHASSLPALTVNPLRGILREILNPSLFADPSAPELVVAATSVRTGEARLFRRGEVTIDALLASSCLPQLFPAVEIDGESYWDGAFSSNPPVRPLIEAGAPADVIIVRTSPGERHMLPHGSSAVRDRMAELSFGTALRGELRGLAQAQANLLPMRDLPPHLARLRDARLHMIGPEADVDLHAALHPTWSFLMSEREQGADVADRWLRDHRASIGARATLDPSIYGGALATPQPADLHA